MQSSNANPAPTWRDRDGPSPEWLGALVMVLLVHGAVLLGYRYWHRRWPPPPPVSAVEVTLLAPPPRSAPPARPRAEPPAPPRPALAAHPRPEAAEPVRRPTRKSAPAAPAPKPAAVVPPSPAAAPSPEAPAVPASGPPSPPLAAEPPAWEPPQFAPAYLHNPSPDYPAFARRHGMTGKVVVKARVGADGTCLAVQLAHGSGYDILDRAALDAVRGWRFVPARRGGRAEAAWVEVPIVFNLED